jgi:acetyltransferase
VSPGEARAMLDQLRLAALLRGVRGERPVDLASLARAISRFSHLLVQVPELDEIEVNPLIAGPEGVLAVDARARLSA